jgi:hypothetical protein
MANREEEQKNHIVWGSHGVQVREIEMLYICTGIQQVSGWLDNWVGAKFLKEAEVTDKQGGDLE